MTGLYVFLFVVWLFTLYLAFLGGRAHKQRHVNRELLKARIIRDEIAQGNTDLSDDDINERLRKR